MNGRCRSLVLLVALCLPACGDEREAPGGGASPRLGADADLPQPDLQARKLALLVGIGDYPGDSPPDLAGPRNDVELVAALLRERFGFPAQNIRTLLDEQATHAGIVRTFREFLIEFARADTEVVFWFAGHGSRILDSSGIEEDGRDASLVAWDSRLLAPDGGYDISDDELHTLLQELTSITDRVVLVTDSCHAEGAMRGDDDARAPLALGTRFAGEGDATLDLALVGPLWTDREILDDDSQKRRPIYDRYVHVAACAAWQVASEWQHDGRAYGMLTWFLVRKLEAAEPGQTWRAVTESVRLEVESRRRAQTPMFDGNVDRLVFGGRFTAPPVGHAARMVRVAGSAADPGELEVDAGWLAGLAVGSQLEVRAADVTVARADVFAVQQDGVRSRARWVDASAALDHGLEPTTPLRVVEVARPLWSPRLAVAATPPGFASGLGLDEWLCEVDVTLADYRLAPAEDVVGFTLRTIEGVPIWPAPRALRPRPGAEAKAVVQNALAYRALERLPAEPGEFALAARFVPVVAEDSHASTYHGRHAHVRPRSATADDQWFVDVTAPDGELAMLEVHNHAPMPLHVVVISLEEAGHRCGAIWGVEDDATLLAPGHSRRVAVVLRRPESWPLARRMRDRYLVLGTPSKLPLQALVSSGGMVMRGDEAPLPFALRALWQSERMRSEPAEPIGPRRFGVRCVDLHLR